MILNLLEDSKSDLFDLLNDANIQYEYTKGTYLKDYKSIDGDFIVEEFK